MATKSIDTRFEDYITLTTQTKAMCDICYQYFHINIIQNVTDHVIRHHDIPENTSYKSMFHYYEIRYNKFHCNFPNCKTTYNSHDTKSSSKRHLESQHKITKDAAEEIRNCLRKIYKYKNSMEKYYCAQKDCDVLVEHKFGSIMSHLFYAHETDISKNSEINKWRYSISSKSLIDMTSETGWTRAFTKYEKKAKCLLCNEVYDSSEEVMKNHMQESHDTSIACKSKAKELLKFVLEYFDLTVTQASKCTVCSNTFTSSLLALTIHFKVSHTEVTIPSWIPTNESLEREMKALYDTYMRLQNLQTIPPSSYQQSSSSNVDIMATKTGDTIFEDYFMFTSDKVNVTCDMCYASLTVKIEIGKMISHLENDHINQINPLYQSDENWHVKYYEIQNKSIKCIFSECEQTYNFNTTVQKSKMHLQNLHNINKHTAEKIGIWLRDKYEFNKDSTEQYYCKLCNNDVSIRFAFIMMHLFYVHQIDPSEDSEIKKMGFSISSLIDMKMKSLINMNTATGWTRAFFINEHMQATCNFCKKDYTPSKRKPLEEVMRNHLQDHMEYTEFKIKAKDLLNLVSKHFDLTIAQASRCKLCTSFFRKSSLYGLTIHLKLKHNHIDTPSWITTTESLDEAMGMVRDSSTHSQNIPSSDQQPPTSHDPSSESESGPKIRRID